MTDYVDQSLPLRRIALFSSGVAFFEHRGELDGDARLTLPFAADDVSDALKSLMVLDPGCVAPLVSYPAENTTAALASLTPDLTGEPGLAALLSALRGAQVEVTCAGETITGRIVSTEERDGGDGAPERYLSVLTNGTVQVLALGSVRAYRFIDDAVTADLERALELLFSGNTASLRHLVVELPSDSRRHREASLCYVVAAPVWKASYRLDLHGDPFLQGWAIIDNASDTDWDGVELSLMAGRPSSFVQRLYEPYYVARREVPLAIAASAEARTYGAGVAWSVAESVEDMPLSPALPGRMRALAQPAPAMADMAVRTPEATAVGEQFAFTLREPLRLERRRSAMVPLVTGAVEARKVSVFTPDGLLAGTPRPPALGLELTNRLGPLPAGPVSVVDDGLYAGDALAEYLPDGDTRLLSYGDDLAVSGWLEHDNADVVSSVRFAHGVMHAVAELRRRVVYRFRNAAPADRLVVVDHPVQDETLVEPETAASTAPGRMRFEVPVAAGTQVEFPVTTTTPLHYEVQLGDATIDTLAHWSARELPDQTQQVLVRAIELLTDVARCDQELATAEQHEARLVAEQQRLRENIASVGADSRSGGTYIDKLAAAEQRLDEAITGHDTAVAACDAARQAYLDYITTVEL